MNILQSSVFPKIHLCTQRDLYFRHNDLVNLSFSQERLHFSKNGVAQTDTYFNSLSIGKWKRHTVVDKLYFRICFKGKLKLVWFVNRLHFSERIVKEVYLGDEVLTEQSISEQPVSEKIVELDFWSQLQEGQLAFRIEAISEAEVYQFSYQTDKTIANQVKLGIVITHFNRQQYVLPALDRLKSELLNDHNWADKVAIYVIDNSQNLPETENIHIIPNKNLGGAGGFSRGLIHLKQQADYTHCLFMDDDASCEIEGIKRTIALLEYANDPTLAIGGAMLREDRMYLQHESGAKFDGRVKPINQGLDLRDNINVLRNEIETQIDFCGWWYFAFPLAEVKHYAFPFFVRGDDIGFSLAHQFNIITLNGIASWQDDFDLKHNPVNAYLDYRSHIIMLHFHHFSEKGLLPLIRNTTAVVIKKLLTYHYDSAEASIIALEDALKGDAFWLSNVDMVEKRQALNNMIKEERVTDIPVQCLQQATLGNPIESKIKRMLRWATLNGNLLPHIFFKKGMVYQPKARGNLREVYRYKQVLYLHEPSHKGFIVTHNRKRFFSLLIRYIKALFKLCMNYSKLSLEYKTSYAKFTSKEFWQEQFK